MRTKPAFAWAVALFVTWLWPARAAERELVVQTDRVNVRAQPSIYSEVLTQLHTGAKVTVLQEIVPERPGPEEPTKWAKIVMPTNTPVWVSAAYVDAATETVKARRLNVRAGPGENYSVVGRLERGAAVKKIRVQDEWMEIDTPRGAYGFVAAEFLAELPEAPPPVAPPPIVAPPAEPKPSPPPPAPAQAEAPPPEPGATVPPPPPPVIEPPPPKRIVRREGIVRRPTSIQAPTDFGLHSLDTGKLINYLYAASAALNLKAFHGKKVAVTGEEGIDERWQSTPVLDVQTLQEVP
jgi:uncharacterized protein YgiM (DUF1202 family)